MTRVLLVRHGQSAWNEAGRWQGQADPPLTDLGRRQARHAARALGAVDAVVASDLQRAAETAAILAGELGVGPVLVDPDLRERHAGAWQGLTRTEIDRDYPGWLEPPGPASPPPGSADGAPTTGDPGGPTPPGGEAVGEVVWQATPPRPVGADGAPAPGGGWVPRRPPGWEPDESLLARAVAALARVHDAVAGGDALVVTHGGLIYAVERSLGAPFERIGNLGGRWVEVGAPGPVALGDRVVLVDPDEVTVPTQI